MLLSLMLAACSADRAGTPVVGVHRAALKDPAPPPTPRAPDPNVVWVMMKDQADLSVARGISQWTARGAAVRDALVSTATLKQTSIQSFLAARSASYTPYWIVNALRVRADAATIEELKRRPDVAFVTPDRVYSVPQPRRVEPLPRVDGVEWGIANVRANEAWERFGSLGEGIVVASIDTGVQFDHPALARQYRGNEAGAIDHNYNWFDPSQVCGSPSLAPCDNIEHGTHTMGTLVGADASGDNQIGVAPGARWITAKGCEDLNCSDEALLASAQWILAPTDLNGENPRPDLRPNIVNNSWGGMPGDPFFQAAVQAWVAAGIFPVFAAGNDGPRCGSASSPGDYPESYAVAAYDESNSIAWFSGRGPGAFGAGKPNIAAPGVAVRSSVPGDAYAAYDGTSMAAPHVAGSIALLWSAAPALVGDIAGTRALLDTGAADAEDSECGGDSGFNYTFGEGRLDSYTTLDIAPRGPTGRLLGAVTSAGKPIAEAKIAAHAQEGSDRSTYTDDAGTYSLRLSVGSYDVSVKAFGYLAQSASGVVITQDTETKRDFDLEPAPVFAVSGTVTDDMGAAIAGAKVSLLGTPLQPAITDATGHYTFGAVPVGQYDVRFDASNCYADNKAALTVSADTILDATLAKRFDAYGYSCVPVEQRYVTATQPLNLSGDDSSVALKLPFTFLFYGKAYDEVNVSSNGVLNFNPDLPYFDNTPIPSPQPPNATIYALWDDLVIDAASGAFTEVLGTAPNRQLVVEWRNVRTLSGDNMRFNFEVIVGEAGDITLQYAAQDESKTIGKLATIGIEDATGGDGLQYSYNEDSLQTGDSIRYSLPPSGLVKGTVTDANDGLPLKDVIVTAKRGDQILRTTETDAKGSYLLQLPAKEYKIGVAPERYVPAQRKLMVEVNTTTEVSFALQTGAPEVKPAMLELVIARGEKKTRELTLTNRGGVELKWSVSEAGGAKQNLASQPAAAPGRNAIASSGAARVDARQQVGRLSTVVGWQTQAPGDVLYSFQPEGLATSWGLGFDGNLWISDVATLVNSEFTVDGTPTQRSWPAQWAGFFPGDMALDSNHGLMCQVAVGGDNGIHCWNRDTGEVALSITGQFEWTQLAQRGLAYDPGDDTFYIGGWDSGTIFHVRGTSHDNPGEVINKCSPPDPNISGLALNTSVGVLWAATNSPTDTVFELNPSDCSVLSTLAHPDPGFNGAGLELDAVGNLWMVSQNRNTVYLVESGVPTFSDIPWMTIKPSAGTLAPGQSETLSVSIDTSTLEPGLYLASLYIVSDAGRTPKLRVPVSVVVSAYQRAVDAGNRTSYTDSQHEVWAADQAYLGDWGYVNDSLTWTSSHSIDGTPDPALYRSLRVNPFGYRFDNVPNGVYQIELRFSQLLDLDPGQRQFDVIVEDTLVLPAYDPAYRSGAYHADDHTFFIPVTDGQLDVRFATRIGLPIINALRVTQRPDR